MNVPRLLCVWLIAVLMCLHGVSWAQPSSETEREVARRLAEAKVLAKQGQWDQARLVFIQAYAIHPTSVLLWDLAIAELKSSHPLDAAQHLQQYRKHPSAEPDKVAALPPFLDRAYSQIGRIELSAPSGATVMLDDTRCDWVAGEPLLVMAGEHSLAISHGDQTQEKRVHLRPGDVLSVSFQPRRVLPEPAGAPSSPALGPTAPPKTAYAAQGSTSFTSPTGRVAPDILTDPGRTGPNAARVVAVVVGTSLTAAAIVAGTVYAVQASSAQTDADRLASGLGPASCTQAVAGCDSLADANQRLHDSQKRAGALFIAAGVLGTATLGALLLWPASRTRAVSVQPTTDGLLVSGRF